MRIIVPLLLVLIGAILTSQTHMVLGELEAVGFGTFANLPTASAVPNKFLYSFTDTFYSKAINNNGTWVYLLNGMQVHPPPTSGWTWVNQGTSTLSTTEGHQTITTPGQLSTNLRMRTRTAPTAPYTVTIVASVITVRNVTDTFTFFIRDSGTSRLKVFHLDRVNTSTFNIGNWTSETSFSSNSSITDYHIIADMIWMQIEDNNTNHIFRISVDGTHWAELYSESRTAWLATPDEIGWAAHDQQNQPTIAHLISWLEE